MTFCDAVQWYKRLGMEVDPGPRLGEITIIHRQHNTNGDLESVNTQVIPDSMLVPMAEVSLDAHMKNQLVGYNSTKIL